MTDHRPFRYAVNHGQFYSPLNGREWEGPYGVWELRGTAAELPNTPLYEVAMRESGDGGPSDTGASWQARAIAAEMAAASLRVEVQEAAARAEVAERGRGAVEGAVRRERQRQADMRHQLGEIARMVAEAYRCELERNELYAPDPDDFDEAPADPTFEQLYEFCAEVLRRDHPSMVYPLPSTQTVDAASTTLRQHIGNGDSIETALSAVLARLAADRREQAQVQP